MSMGKKVGIGLTGLDVLVILYTERPGMLKMLRMGQGLSLLDFSQTLENHGGKWENENEEKLTANRMISEYTIYILYIYIGIVGIFLVSKPRKKTEQMLKW